MGCMTFDLIEKYPYIVIPSVLCVILFSMVYCHLLIRKINCQLSVLSVEFIDKMTKEKYAQWKQNNSNTNVELNLIGPIFARNKTSIISGTPHLEKMSERKRLQKLRSSLRSRAKSTLKLMPVWVYLRLSLKNQKATTLKSQNETLFSSTFGLPQFNPIKLPYQLGVDSVTTSKKNKKNGRRAFSEDSTSSSCSGEGYDAQSHVIPSEAVVIEDMEAEVMQATSHNNSAHEDTTDTADTERSDSDTEACEMIIDNKQGEAVERIFKVPFDPAEHEIIIL